MLAFLVVMHVLICVLLVVSVLLQAGRGGGLSGSFGSGGGQALFGGRGAGTFFSKATVVLGALFFVSSLGLALLSSQSRTATRRSLVQEAARRAAPEAPPAGTNAAGQLPGATTPGTSPSRAPATSPQGSNTTQPANPQGK